MLFVMGVTSVFDEGQPFGFVFIVWYIAGIFGIIGLWKLGMRFQWKRIEIRKNEWFYLFCGGVACFPFPYFVRWRPDEPYGFLALYAALALALSLTFSIVWFHKNEKRKNMAEPGVPYNSGQSLRD
jgi:hypothetical protein